jgi:hypothetical protein
VEPHEHLGLGGEQAVLLELDSRAHAGDHDA